MTPQPALLESLTASIDSAFKKIIIELTWIVDEGYLEMSSSWEGTMKSHHEMVPCLTMKKA